MKSLAFNSLFILISISTYGQFIAGEDVRVSDPYSDDLYVAGGEVTIDSPINGDCITAGGIITINDSIAADLIIAGGEINVQGVIGDDLRAAGGDIFIDSEVLDDLIVFGGQLRVSPNAVIYGNVVCYGGKLTMEGTVLGAMRASGGQIEITGSVHGPTTLAAESLTIHNGAQFLSSVNYWAESGEVDFGNSVQNGEATYNTSLAFEGEKYAREGFLVGISIFFILVYLIGGFILLLLLEWAFEKKFIKAAAEIDKSQATSLGFGLIYIIGAPILVLICFGLVVGIPLGILVLLLYLYSLLFGNFVAALVFTHFWKSKQGKTWSVFTTSLIAFLIAMAFQALTSIPFVGPLVSFALLCLTYGAIILGIRSSKKGSSDLSGPVDSSVMA